MGLHLYQRPFFLVALSGALLLSFFVLKPFLIPLSLGIIFSVILHPVYSTISRWTGGRKSLSALATVLISIAVLLTAAGFLGAQIVQEAQGLFGNGGTVSKEGVVAFSMRLAPVLETYIPGGTAQVQALTRNLGEYAQEALSWLSQHIGTALVGITSGLLSLFVFFVSLYYLLKDGENLKRRIVALSPLSNNDDETVLSQLGLAVNSVVRGQLSIALLQGVLTGIGFWIFGVPNPALWGMVAFFAALVPSVGTALVITPAIAFLLFTGEVGMGLGLALWGFAAVGLIDNMLAPRLIGSGMKLHPLLVLLSVLGGIALFGGAGIFLGPLSLSLFFALLSLHTYLAQSSDIAES